nr:trypsin-like peptidase domain-containing protein [Nonomuraea sp. FMUSA5-5]
MVTRELVLTCAHVVAEAAGSSGQKFPRQTVIVDFPAHLEDGEWPARILPEAWFPAHETGGDFAILIVNRGPGLRVRPAKLRPCGQVRARSVKAFGHPKGYDGVWAEAEMIGPGPGREWIQLHGGLTGQRIRQGFSGAGVVDDDDAVIGCVVAADNDPQTRVAWMAPLEHIGKYWTRLARMISAAPVDLQVTAPAPVPAPRVGEQDIVAMLLNFTELRNSSTRRLYKDYLRARFRFLVIEDRDQVIDDMSSLVRACLDQPGAIHELLSFLEQRHSGPPYHDLLEQVRREVDDHVPAPLLSTDERADLYHLLEDVEDPRFEIMYEQAIEPANPAPSGDGANPITMLRSLEGLTSSPDGIPPLVRFLELLARNVDTWLNEEIRSWVDAFVDRQGISQIALRRLRHRISSMPHPSISYLITQFDNDGPNPDRFLVTVWVQHGRGLGRPLSRSDEALALSEVPALIERLLSHTSIAALPAEELWLEFILPRSMINSDIEQWEIYSAGLAHPLGVDHPVVVRSLDRLLMVAHDRRLRHGWKDKWSGMRSDPGTGADTILWVQNPSELSHQTLYARLCHKNVCALGMTFPPQQRLGLVEGDEVSTAISAGIAVVIWPHSDVNPDAFKTQVTAALNAEGMNRLPEIVLRLRKQAVSANEPTNHAGHKIAVLWDDADRIPEIYVPNSYPV